MVAHCWCGGCDWEAVDPSAVALEVLAETHRREMHSWVRVGKCHRVELEPHEQQAVDEGIAAELRAKAIAAAQTGEAKSLYDRRRR